MESETAHILINVYLIINFIGTLYIMLRVHEIKYFLKLFFEIVVTLNSGIQDVENKLTHEYHCTYTPTSDEVSDTVDYPLDKKE